MQRKILLFIIMVGVFTLSTVGCGVPKTEHEKTVQELEKANQEKATLSEQMSQLKSENESLSQKLSQMESEMNTLRQENEALKSKLSSKKPAVQPKKK